MNQNKQVIGRLDTIYQRRSVRSYLKRHVSNNIIDSLIDAAIHAPTAMHQEALAFAVIQDQDLLKRISDHAKKLLAEERKNPASPFHHESLDYFTNPAFNIFYGADALVIIFGKSDRPFISADCWLAAENLMLAACHMGIGSCVVGLAVEALNSKELRNELEIPDNLTAFAPIILGYPSEELPAKSRKKPNVIFKKNFN